MSIATWAILVLSGLLVVATSAAYGYRKDKLATDATVAPLLQAANDANALANKHLEARQKCSAEMQRVREANERALAQAQRDAEAAEKSAEDYMRRLENPTDADCNAFLESKVCPMLRDY